ncbi:iron transporter [Longispora fulva]|uniref:High-affinity iron transporter n=1 Tax=Longispora fulva TaxID=619741 RepID=A0A8J7KZ76_9ACTN|nr:iron uptake transporter permease EfeU [Longispora fulva]MBG6140387.1 high-affinity iron transporter [Longispora fulva]GIG57232.1 iron transporter [Longispora fulva]
MNAILPNYLIGLREGLECTLVVSILIAYLVKANRRDQLLPVWVGVGVALALSVGAGVLLTWTVAAMGEYQPHFEGVTSYIAVGFVTWMIFWMRRTARSIKGELTGKLDDALQMGQFAVVAMAFMAIIREGLETSLIYISAAQSTGGDAGAMPLLGLCGGGVTSVLLGIGLYRAALRINLAKFFKWTGVLLVLVAAGIFKYGTAELQTAHVIGWHDVLAYDITGWYDESSWYASLLAGLFNFTAKPTVPQLVAYLAYLIPVLTYFLWPQAAPKPAAKPVTTNEGATL